MSPTLNRKPISGSASTQSRWSSRGVNTGVLILGASGHSAVAASLRPAPTRVENAPPNSLREPVMALLLFVGVCAVGGLLIYLRTRRRMVASAPSRIRGGGKACSSLPGGPAQDRLSRLVPFPPSAEDVPDWNPGGATRVTGTGLPPVLSGAAPAPQVAPIPQRAPGPARLVLGSHSSPSPRLPAVAVVSAESLSAGTVEGAPAVAAPEAMVEPVNGAPAPSLVPASAGLPPTPRLKLTQSPVPTTVVHVTPAMEYARSRGRDAERSGGS